MIEKKGSSVMGYILIFIGLGFLLNQFGIFRIFGFTFWELFKKFWPVIFLTAGVTAFIRQNYNAGLFFVGLGAIFQASVLYDWSIWKLWPVAVIYIGLRVIFKDSFKFGGTSSGTYSEDYIKDTVFFWGEERKVKSQNFKGGKVSCLFGGLEINLRDVLVSAEGAELRIFCTFGGIEILLPKNCAVESAGKPLFGVWEEDYSDQNRPTSPLLRITGSVKFGAVEIED